MIERPLLRYFGAKWRLADWIISQFPSHTQYVEPFAGSAAVLFKKHPSKQEVINDVNSDLFSLYSILRDKSKTKELKRLLEWTLYSRDENDFIKTHQHERTGDELEDARRYIARVYMNIGGHTSQMTGFRVDNKVNGSVGYKTTQNQYLDVVRLLFKYHSRLQSVIVENLDYQRIIEKYDTPETLFYVDPPYPKESRSGGNYKHEFTTEDHRNLVDVLHKTEGKWILSGYHCELYDELYAGLRTETKTTIDMCLQQKTEVLWMNYEPTQGTLFDEKA